MEEIDYAVTLVYTFRKKRGIVCPEGQIRN